MIWKILQNHILCAFVANLKMRFTRFIRKVFVTKILLPGKFLLFLTLLAGLFRCLATGRFHPSKTLFARKRSSRESEREVKAEAAENTGFQPE